MRKIVDIVGIRGNSRFEALPYSLVGGRRWNDFPRHVHDIPLFSGLHS